MYCWRNITKKYFKSLPWALGRLGKPCHNRIFTGPTPARCVFGRICFTGSGPNSVLVWPRSAPNPFCYLGSSSCHICTPLLACIWSLGWSILGGPRLLEVVLEGPSWPGTLFCMGTPTDDMQNQDPNSVISSNFSCTCRCVKVVVLTKCTNMALIPSWQPNNSQLPILDTVFNR